jgi:hypothetical protein
MINVFSKLVTSKINKCDTRLYQITTMRQLVITIQK